MSGQQTRYCANKNVQLYCYLPAPTLRLAEALRVSGMQHTVKAVDVVPTVRCKDLVASAAKLDTGQERHPA